MTSEFVAGSAWMKPPVDGPAEALTAAAAPVDVALAVPDVPAGLGASGLAVGELPPALLLPVPAAALKAARRTVASFAASAFFR